MGDRSKRRRRATFLRWMLDLHTYGGLLCSSYLVIYGVSSIRFNHRDLFPVSRREVVTWTRPIEWPEASGDLERAEAIRGDLGMFGEIYDQTFRVDSAGDLDFEIYRAMKNFRVRTDRASGTAEVDERRMALGSAFDGLHGAGPAPGSKLMSAWWMFSEVSWLFIVFSAVSGVYLWASRGTSSLRWKGMGAAAAGFLLLSYLVMR